MAHPKRLSTRLGSSSIMHRILWRTGSMIRSTRTLTRRFYGCMSPRRASPSSSFSRSVRSSRTSERSWAKPFRLLVIALKSGSSPFAILAQIAFLGISVLSLAFGVAYKTSTPSLYDGNAHVSLGWIVTLASIALNAADLVRVFAPSSVKQLIGSLKGSRRSSEEEGRPLVAEEFEQYALSSPTEMDETEQGHHWTEVEMSSALRNTQPIRRSSTNSSDEDGTLYDSAGTGEERNKIVSLSSKIQSYAEGLNSAANVLLVVLAYVEFLSGIAVYSGSCRGSYLNG